MGGKASTHTSSNATPQADLYRGAGYTRKGYRKNGYDHIKSTGRKARYSQVRRIQAGLKKLMDEPQKMFKTVPDAGKATHAQRYFFGHGRNFMYSKPPYSNQAHHMLPQEFWQGLTPAQRRILRGQKYSINDGSNVVFLPQDSKGHAIHQLPKHNGSHPRYTSQVKIDASNVEKSLKDAVEQGKDCDEAETPKNIVKKLNSLQARYWKILTKSLASVVNDVIVVTDTSDV